jgi:hypothetical protein
MSDLKRICPGCDSWTSAIGAAFRDGEPCPYCGLPAEAAHLIDEAQERNVSQKVLDRLAAAEIRAAKAEAAFADYRIAVTRAMRVLKEVADVER